eukprot:750249-Hanusia_phi.AAC.6
MESPMFHFHFPTLTSSALAPSSHILISFPPPLPPLPPVCHWCHRCPFASGPASETICVPQWYLRNAGRRGEDGRAIREQGRIRDKD